MKILGVFVLVSVFARAEDAPNLKVWEAQKNGTLRPVGISPELLKRLEARKDWSQMRAHPEDYEPLVRALQTLEQVQSRLKRVAADEKLQNDVTYLKFLREEIQSAMKSLEAQRSNSLQRYVKESVNGAVCAAQGNWMGAIESAGASISLLATAPKRELDLLADFNAFWKMEAELKSKLECATMAHAGAAFRNRNSAIKERVLPDYEQGYDYEGNPTKAKDFRDDPSHPENKH